MPRWFRYALTAAIALAGISLFGLAATSSDSRLFERYFPLLIVINRTIAVLLFAIVAAMVVRLVLRLRRRQFGAHLTGRLAFSGALLALVPCLIIFLVSAVFISRSINSWFDVRVERALDSGVTITRGILVEQQKRAENTALHLARLLENTPQQLILPDLMKLLEGEHDTEALVFNGENTAIAAAGSRINVMLPDFPTPMQMQAVRTSGIYSVIDGNVPENAEQSLTDALSIRVIVPIRENRENTSALSSGLRPSSRARQLYLQIIQSIPTETVQNATELLAGYRDYQTLVLSRESLLSIYTGTLFLTLLMAVFGAVASALTFARKSIEPLMQLEEGTRRVAGGNFRPIREFSGNNELNVLTQSFNLMIREVGEARHDLEEKRREAQQARTYLESVLANISSGVIVTDADFTIVTANEAAKRILGGEVCRTGRSLAESEPVLFQALKNRERVSTERSSTVSFELERPGRLIPIYLQTSPMPLGESTGRVIVFDDITQLVEAQRATAWGEVARRLAHEIKNPLTPIRLAAERLEMKLERVLSREEDLALLHKTIGTITSQVDALKQMVNDFREYAKLPAAKLKPTDLNDFLRQTAELYTEAGIAMKLTLDPALPKIEADAGQLRQVIHNLVSNSIDAAEGDRPVIEIETRSNVSPPGARTVRMVFRDNGTGFSEKLLARAFEPYVTTKPTGTGLGLPMVKKILDEHHAAVTLSNRLDKTGFLILGAQVDILFRPCGEPPEPRV